MTDWLTQAQATFPDRPKLLARSQYLGVLCLYLRDELQAAHLQDPPNQDLIERIWGYIGWCRAPERDPEDRRVAGTAFLGAMPHLGPGRRALARRLTQAEFEELLPVWKRRLSPVELRVFIAQVLSAMGASAAEVARVQAEAAALPLEPL